MAVIKKNQLNNLFFVMVDKTDFASIESGLDAADINVKMWGAAHGSSDAASAITVTKAPALVRSGIFQQTLEADETDAHDVFVIRFSSTSTVSCAIQVFTLEAVDNDDSDIFSAISDMRSTMDSQFTWQSNMLSQMSVLLSDVESAVDSQFLVYQSDISDVKSAIDRLDSALVAKRGSTASIVADASQMEIDGIDHDSEFNGMLVGILSESQINELRLITDTDATASKLTVAPAFNSRLESAVNYVILRTGQPIANLVRSQLSDVESAIDSQFTVYLSDHSDIISGLSELQSRINTSAASDSALSKFRSNFDSRIPSEPSGRSQLSVLGDSILSAVSDVESAIDSQFLVYQSDISNLDSQVNLIDSALVTDRGSTKSTVADASAIEIPGIDHDSEFNGQLVRIFDGSQINEVRLIVNTNATSSQITVKPAFNSRLVSGVNYAILATGQPWQSAMHSDLASAISDSYSGISNMLSQAGLPEHIASLVWDADKGSYVDASSMGSVLQATGATPSAIADKVWSDYQSKVGATPSQVVSNTSDALSNILSMLTAAGLPEHIASLVWDADKGSYVDASSMGSVLQATGATPSAIADKVWSDYQSKVGQSPSQVFSNTSDALSNILSMLTAAGFPEHIASLVWDADKGSYVDASSMGSVLQAATATPSAIADKVWSDFASKAGPTISNFVSNVSHMLSNASGIHSDAYSLLSDLNSNLFSRMPAEPSSRSQLSGLISDVQSQLSNAESNIMSSLSRVRTKQTEHLNVDQILLTSLASQVADTSVLELPTSAEEDDDIYNGAVCIVRSGDLTGWQVFAVDYNGTTRKLTVKPALPSALASATSLIIRSGQPWLSLMHSDIASKVSNVESALDSQFTVVQSDHSDMISGLSQLQSRIPQVVATSDIQSDVYSLLSDLQSDFQSRVGKAVATQSQVSDLASDLKSAISNVESAIDSQFTVYQSDISDIKSNLSDAVSRITAVQSDLPDRPTKNTAIANFPFVMIDSADNVSGKTGLTITSERSIDGGAFASTTNTATELANGVYLLNISAADMNGDEIIFRFSAAGALDRFVTMVTKPT